MTESDMNLNQIQLPPQLVASLYEQCLLETPPGTGNAPAEPVQDASAVNYLGNFQKKIMVVVETQGAAFIGDPELQFLTNVLTACRLSLADIAIINIVQSPASAVLPFIEKAAARHVLLFGVSPLAIDLPMNFPAFQIQRFGNCIFLCAPELKTIEKNKQLKTSLWNSLKNLFEI